MLQKSNMMKKKNNSSPLHDLRLKLGSVLSLAGPSQCGKTELVNKIIKQANYIFTSKPDRILWYYGEVAPSERIKGVTYLKSLPPETDEIKNKSLIVLDDLAVESIRNVNITNLFTRVAHHKQCFIIYITQNLFQQGGDARTRALNTHYLILFKNVRDSSIIHTLARQMGSGQFLIDVFNHATAQHPYGYLLIDLRVETLDYLRLRSNIIIDNKNNDMTVYINNNNNIFSNNNV